MWPCTRIYILRLSISRLLTQHSEYQLFSFLGNERRSLFEQTHFGFMNGNANLCSRLKFRSSTRLLPKDCFRKNEKQIFSSALIAKHVSDTELEGKNRPDSKKLCERTGAMFIDCLCCAKKKSS